MAKLAILAALCTHQGVAVETYRLLAAVGAVPLGCAGPDGPGTSHVPAMYRYRATEILSRALARAACMR